MLTKQVCGLWFAYRGIQNLGQYTVCVPTELWPVNRMPYMPTYTSIFDYKIPAQNMRWLVKGVPTVQQL